MTHARPIPEAATPPWPAHPAPRQAAQAVPEQETKAPKEKAETNWTRAGVGIGIGSAAIVAALLYSNWSKSGAKKK